MWYFFFVYVATKRVELRRRSVAASARKGVSCFFKFKCLLLRSVARDLWTGRARPDEFNCTSFIDFFLSWC